MNDARSDHAPAFPRSVLLLAAGAVVLRLVLLLGRGDYLAFDEGWYLLLARSLFTGEGYSLVGFPHISLSPLFPVLAGAAGELLRSWVWGGRVVAALASGLLVLPAWAVFRRLAPRRTALIAVALVAVLPSMAPFVVPFWIGADLWVGAEPLLHLFLFLGIALWLRADERDDGTTASLLSGPFPSWLAAGAAFGLAFLARPEAIITWGLLGLVALALAAWRRSPRRLFGATLMGLGFVLLAAPYWLYIHDVSGRWRLSGRGVEVPTVAIGESASGPTTSRPGSSRTIERMLWQDDQAYRERLYGLDATGLRLRSDYWGVPPAAAAADSAAPEAGSLPAADAVGAGGAAQPDTVPAAPSPGAQATPGPTARAPTRGSEQEPPSPANLYLRSMAQIFPLLLWLFAILGAAEPRGRSVLRRELPVTGALVGTSLAIAVVVAVDPRTQLFLVPLLAFYAARGFGLIEETIRDRVADAPLRPGFIELLLVATALVWLLGIDGRRLYLSLSLGSPHHVVAAQNREVAEELDELLGDDHGPVASWHPAIAVYADRDWRVLPYADLPHIVRYLDAAGADAMVLSAYYPPDLGVENLNTRYLVIPVPDADGPPHPWRLRLLRGDTIRAVGRLEDPSDTSDTSDTSNPSNSSNPSG